MIKRTLQKIGFVPIKTQVHNDSDKPILLIPYIAPNGEDPEKISIIKGLAKKFEAHAHQKVNSTKYVLGDFYSQIYFLLRTVEGNGKRDIDTIFKDDYPDGITHKKEGEKRYMHTHLSNNSEVKLHFDNDKKEIIGLGDDAGQTSNAKKKTEAEYLEEMLKLLKVVVESLQERKKALGSGSGQ